MRNTTDKSDSDMSAQIFTSYATELCVSLLRLLLSDH